MSKTADWMREKYVDPMEAEFLAVHGRFPTMEEDAKLWEEAFRLAKLEGLELG
jgi:hypothetical protein